ncbi:PEPxxWA-CTERM sorting domain-containing protein [Sphingomonas sp.]|uniref:PEPxxWA-CTERM sorting domain-containing protein n=1 Tax=Sphingomonas sp. TaxID=28214 RepID=UPI000DB57716|nr:PEPxxWA-CTERM sorting domain-containing protein [Sphingomonas sp.]PZU06612.1 MAG: hypothetical protein DI605_18540 [Sphingomonas sp.]
MRHLLAAALFAIASPATSTILVNSSFAPDSYYMGTGGDMETLSADLAGQPGGYAFGALDDAAAVAAASALFINLRMFDIGSYDDPVGQDQQFTDAEIANVNAFLATGKRVVIVGDNQSFSNWDKSILALAGNNAPDTLLGSNGLALPIVANELTEGTGPLNIIFGGSHTTGGIDLYEQQAVTLWRAQSNLLTILDVNVLDDVYGNRRFQQNVAAWLGASAATELPEPATWAAFVIGFGLIGATMRQRRFTVRSA